MIGNAIIIAQASARGNSARGIVRLSGEGALKAVVPFFSPSVPDKLYSTKRKTAESFILNGFFKPWGNEQQERRVKCAMFYWFQGHGFTGEEALELHLPGSPPVLNASIKTICSGENVRLAKNGEFTLRAFLNGRLDLTQAEAILATIDASSDGDLNGALAQLSGSLSGKFERLRNELLDALSDLEASFDFTEENIEFISSSSLRNAVSTILKEIESVLYGVKMQLKCERIPRVILLGKPNVGKSSLFNELVDKYAVKKAGKALVSGLAGTTRDYLEAELVVDETRFVLIDSAGVERDVSNSSIAELREDPRLLAQRSLIRAAKGSDLVVHCFDSQSTCDNLAKESFSLSGKLKIEVLTKCDVNKLEYGMSNLISGSTIKTSAATKKGVVELGKLIAKKLSGARTGATEIVPSTALRCQEALREAQNSLKNALKILDGVEAFDESLVAAELRLALNQIGLITGRTQTNDLLDRIFSRFCIGK